MSLITKHFIFLILVAAYFITSALLHSLIYQPFYNSYCPGPEYDSCYVPITVTLLTPVLPVFLLAFSLVYTGGKFYSRKVALSIYRIGSVFATLIILFILFFLSLILISDFLLIIPMAFLMISPYLGGYLGFRLSSKNI